MNTSIMFSAQSNEWATPQKLFDELNREFSFTLDPAATAENAKCARYYTEEQNGLLQSWSDERAFMNPPYGCTIGLWVKKAVQETIRGALVVCLLPARTDTRWWSYLWNYKTHQPRKWIKQIRFVRGRIKFGSSKSGAPFPSVIVVMQKQ